jgi:outer membrane protein assembly factor BamB
MIAILVPVLLMCIEVPSWPQFRGPESAGVAVGSARALTEFSTQSNVLWRVALPSGHSSPSVWGDRVFVNAFDSQTKKLELIAIDRKTGKILWRRTAPAATIEEVHPISSPATATPLVDGERVISYFASCGMFAYNLDGKELWSMPLPQVQTPFGSGNSPIRAGDLILLSRDEGEEPYLLAVDRHSGKPVWKQKQYAEPRGGNFNESSPVVWKDEVIVHHRNEVVGYDLKTGARKWWVDATTQGTNTPLAGPDSVFVGTWFNTGEPDLRASPPDFDALLKENDKDHDGFLSKEEFPAVVISRRIDMENVKGATVKVDSDRVFSFVDQNKDGKISRDEWAAFVKVIARPGEDHGTLAIKPGGTGNVTKSNVIWKESRGVPEVPMALYASGRVYTVTNGGTVSCMDAASGKLLFRGRLGAPGAYLASPVIAGDKIYLSSNEGVITVIRASDKLEILAHNDLHEPLFATPAIVEGIIYVRTPTQMYAFGPQ